MRKKGFIIRVLGLLAFVAFLAGCAAIQKGTEALAEKGKISERDRDSIVKTSEALRTTFSEISEAEEYYIGRSVAAMILSRYPAYANEALNRYVNIVGNAVAAYSDRPEIYSGYHFLVLDTEEVNAMAAPSGFIFISKGLIRRCQDEEMLAVILAHEVGHVAAKHGLQSIKKSRLIDAFQIIGSEAVQRYGSEKLAKLTSIFEGALGDIIEKLIERGYDRKLEYEADKLGIKFAEKTGYSPAGLKDFLQTMVGDKSAAAGKGWFKTHPTPQERIERVNKEISTLGAIPQKQVVRTQRFKQSVGTIS